MPTNDSIQQQKERLRQAARLTRDALSREMLVTLSNSVIDRLLQLSQFNQATTVMTYISAKGEVRTHDLVQRLWNSSVRVLVPVIATNGALIPHEITNWSDVSVDNVGRCTPVTARRYEGAIDVDIVPGILFSQTGHRLGSGYGFYDRFIAAYPDTLHIGLAFELQLVQDLPIEPHDEQLDYIVTNQRVISADRLRSQ